MSQGMETNFDMGTALAKARDENTGGSFKGQQSPDLNLKLWQQDCQWWFMRLALP